jgi:PAS domain S-box-containing protein
MAEARSDHWGSGAAPDFENFFDNVPVALHAVAADGRIGHANRAELALLGYEREEYIGRHIADFHVDRPIIDDIMERLARGLTVEKVPARLRAKDGSIRHVEISSSGHFVEGQLAYTQCCTLDVTATKVAEERHSLGQRRFKHTLDALPIAVYTTDPNGRITYFNEAAADLAGRRPTLGEMWCVTWRLYQLDGTRLPHDQCPMAVALKERRPVTGVEAIAERPDGTRRRFAPYPTPLFDEAGVLIGGVNMLLDVTERHERDMERARLAAIVMSSDDAIISKTLDSTITSWNAGATRIFGYEAEEMIGQPINRLIPLERHGEERQVIAKLARGERVEHYETVRMAKDGRRIDISLTVSPLRDRLGNIVGASKVGRDISERKRAEEMQSLLVGELSHRIKNTLATVQSMAKQTLRRSKSIEEFVNSFEGRLQALASAHSMLSDSHWQGAELTSLIHKIVAEDGGRMVLSGPQIMLGSQATLHLSMLLHELATNARKYGALSGPGGQLALSWSLHRSPEQAVHLSWVETGHTLMRPGKPGFGSKLIQSLVNGGHARMSYGASGISWEIRMLLPEPVPSRLPQFLQPQASIASNGSTQRRNLMGKRVLVVEDEPLVLLELEQILEDAGVNVVAREATLASALGAIQELRFDAALLDANLGGEQVDELAAGLASRKVPFMFLSGYERESLPAAFRDSVLVPKPFTAQQVLDGLGALFATNGSNVLQLLPRD